MNAMSKSLSIQDGFLRLPDVLQVVNLSRTTLYRRISAGEFPEPYDLGGRASGWRRSEVEKWLAERVPRSRSG